jgi:hypothetical protein
MDNVSPLHFFLLYPFQRFPLATFSPSQGIQQGDPLSPFLFILMEEDLGNSIKELSEQEKWKGLNIHGEEKPTTHQQFVVDTMFMENPIVREAHQIKQFLKTS